MKPGILFVSLALMVSNAALAASDRARPAAARVDIAMLNLALDAFAADCGRYPSTSEGFQALLHRPDTISGERWHGPYLDRAPMDPWGNEYFYRGPGIHHTNGFDIYSCGADGLSKSGGCDPDDINNWDPNSPHGGNAGLFARGGDFLLFVLAFLGVPVVLLLGMALFIASKFSRRVRDTIALHPRIHSTFFVLVVVEILLLLYCVIPRIC